MNLNILILQLFFLIYVGKKNNKTKQDVGRVTFVNLVQIPSLKKMNWSYLSFKKFEVELKQDVN